MPGRRQQLRVILTVLCLIAGLVGTTEASAKRVKWSVAPTISMNFGQTEYEMDLQFTQFDTASNKFVTERIRSLLEFPTDFLMGGVEIEVRSHPDRLDYWGIEASLLTSLTNPGNKMTDFDWHAISGFFDLTHFSFTESDVEGKAYQLQLQGYRRLFGSRELSVAVLGGFQYYKIDQDIIGFDGWQRPFDVANTRYADSINITGTSKAIIYRVTYKMPHIGLKGRLLLPKENRIELKGALMAVFASDFDDHLLRKKRSTASGTGWGFQSELKIHLVPNPAKQKNRIFVDLAAKFLTLKVTSNQTQRWYETVVENDTEIPEGTVIPGVPHDFRSTQYNLGLRVGIGL